MALRFDNWFCLKFCQMRQTIKSINNENKRLKEQLMQFVTESEYKPAPDPDSSIASFDQSDSLYQMLQEYMAENQKLKDENDKSGFLISYNHRLLRLSEKF